MANGFEAGVGSGFGGLKDSLFAQIRAEVDDERVIRAMERVSRENFVPDDLHDRAYDDAALPIGQRQTISQPLMVAMMVSALRVRRSDKVLEVGTGSGYQAAVLAELAGRVITVERVPELSQSAAERLAALGYTNVDVYEAGPELGRRADGPYDAIIVAAAAPRLPRALMDQLAMGGRLVVPVGSADTQELMRVIRGPHDFSIHTLGGCRFVPLIGDGAWAEDDPDLLERTGDGH